MSRYRYPEKGFTIAEVLIASALMLIAGLILMQIFVPAVKVWMATERGVSISRAISSSLRFLQTELRASAPDKVFIKKSTVNNGSDLLFFLSPVDRNARVCSDADYIDSSSLPSGKLVWANESVIFIKSADSLRGSGGGLYFSRRFFPRGGEQDCIAGFLNAMDTYPFTSWPRPSLVASEPYRIVFDVEDNNGSGVCQPSSSAVTFTVYFKYLNAKGKPAEMSLSSSASIMNR